MPPTDSQIRAFLSGRMDRREFIRLGLKSSLVFNLSTLLGCVYSSSSSPAAFDSAQEASLENVLNHIFPSEKDSPGAREINALPYLHFVLLDPRVEQKEKKLLTNALDWMEQEALVNFEKNLHQLNSEELESLLIRTSSEVWAENWLSTLIMYVLEALLSDPIYGCNPNGVGWKWLEHNPGVPRPGRHNRYPEML